MDVEGRRFELVVASDVSGDDPALDAIALELVELTAEGRATLAEVRLTENDTRWTFSAYERDLPLAAIEWLVGESRRRLGLAPDEV